MIKRLLIFLGGMAMLLPARAQNRVGVLNGQSLRLAAPTVSSNRNLAIDSGYLSISTYRFLSLGKTASGQLNPFLGINSGNLTSTGGRNTGMGETAGAALTGGENNSMLGTYSGAALTDGSANTFVGYKAGNVTTTGGSNAVVGNSAGAFNTSGEKNTFIGLDAGWSNTSGSSNVFLGRGAMIFNASGSSNVALGNNTGAISGSTTSIGNVLIGHSAGYNETGSGKLYIANTNTTTPLIYGEFTAPGKVVVNTRVGFETSTFPASATTSSGSTNTSAYKAFVNGGLLARSVTVSNSWADYVFENGYQLRSLTDVEAYILTHGHLPNVPSAKDIESNGIQVADIARTQQEKIEELTLYIIGLRKKLKDQTETLHDQKAALADLSQRIKSLKN